MDNIDWILKKKGVIGYALGYKVTGKKHTNKDAIVIFVEHKKPLSKIEKDQIIPDKINGMPTDVRGQKGKISTDHVSVQNERYVYVGSDRKDKNRNNRKKKEQKSRYAYVGHKPRTGKWGRKRKSRPIKSGMSISHYKGTAGTLGHIFRDKDNDLVILSNNHVIANRNGCQINDIIYQPGVVDGRGKCARIAKLKKYRAIRNNTDQDSAIARLTTDQVAYDIHGIGIAKGFSKIKLGEGVYKSGRTSGVTSGKVLGIEGTFDILYSNGRSYRMRNCIVTSHMCEYGDSGSILVNDDHEITGLCFAGSDHISIHNDIYPIKRFYDLRLAK